ncbi:MAG TPA: NAD-dependent epimerase/dehydratase family protein, partial [Anaerolineae bacterium]|nr:NAD-dependent epimerase/dehydratase family protein [Anaerolineae bacterium]
GRINDPLTLRQQLKETQPRIIIHLAGAEARGRDRLLRHVDIEGTERLLEESRRAGIERLIYVSRMNANHLDSHALLKAKGEAERLIQQSGIPYTILRPATLYGRNDRFFEIIVGVAIWTWPLVWLPGGGHVSFQPLWVEDFVRCLAATVDRPDLINKTITLAGEEKIFYRDLVRLLLTTTGKRRIAVPLPMTLMRQTSRFIFYWWYWPAISQYFIDRFFVPEITEYDTIMRHFGFRPARIRQNISYLNRRGLAMRIFRH